MNRTSEHRSTTVLGVIRDGKACIAGDGQVTFGETVIKHTAKKVRKLHEDRILAGFAGSVADSITLFEKMEEKLESTGGNLPKASVELARLWRSDKILRRLEAMLAVLDHDHAFIITGSGDILEPEDRIVAIGSGGPFAASAAKALLRHTDLDARAICEQALQISADVCIYTNREITVLEL
jgi:ATP-dependent HslUV protease subunit HslV